MSRHIHVTRESADCLYREEWTFWFIGVTLVLDRYVSASRRTRRHKYTMHKPWFDRLRERGATMDPDDVPIPDDVRDEALRTIASSLNVARRFP